MKKILVVLLILAVAGGVFAQGNWSLSGKVHLGAEIDFLGIRDDAVPAPTNNQNGYGLVDNQDNPRFKPANFDGELGLNYGLGGFEGGLTFKAKGPIEAKMGFAGDRYNLGAAGRLNTLLGEVGTTLLDFMASDYYNVDFMGGTKLSDADKKEVAQEIGFLQGAIYNYGLSAWGDYLFLDGLVKMTVAVAADKAPDWGSNNAFLVNSIAKDTIMDRQGDFYASLNERSGLTTEVILPGINFGVMLRSTKINKYTPFFWESFTSNLDFFDEVLKKMIFGMKFDFQPIDIAAQFNIERLGAYIGLNWAFTDVITAGLSFMGEFQNPDPDADNFIKAAFGASIAYDTGVFCLGLKAGYGYDAEAEDAEEGSGGVIAVAPEVWFKVIPAHLYAFLNTKFEFGSAGFGWKFEPGVVWNFKGDGAMNSDDVGTGIFLKYNLEKPIAVDTIEEGTSAASIGFKWNF